KQAFGGQLFLERQKRLMQVAPPRATQGLYLYLIISTRFVKGDAHPEFAFLPHLGHKTYRLRPPSEHDGTHHRAFVLDRKIPMAGRRLREIGDFPTYPD